jgi:hypothetical protein
MVRAHAIRKGFLHLIGHERAHQVESRRDSACGLWPDLRIAYVNPAWQRFAERNGGQGVRSRWSEGARLLDAIPDTLRAFYERHLKLCLDYRQTWISEYDCSSPTKYRVFRMSVRPVGHGEGLMVLHTCLLQCPHHDIEPDRVPRPARYVDPDGLIHQCVHCRRVRRVGQAEHWDWIPEWVEHVPLNASGGLCPACLATRYPDLAGTTT